MTVQEAIKFIVNKRDKNLLTDSKKFKAYLQDLCSDDNPKELKIINRALEDKILARIFGNERDNVKIARLRDEFEDQGLSETWSEFIINSFAQVLGWNYSNKVSTQNNSIQPNCEEGILTKEILQQLDINYAQKTSINIPEICVYNEAQQNGNSTEYKVKYIKITGIGDSLFQNCTSLQSISLPNSVTTIGNGAFCSCSSLTKINIPEGTISIGKGAFYSCNSLQSLTLPKSLINLGNTLQNSKSQNTKSISNGTSKTVNCSRSGMFKNIFSPFTEEVFPVAENPEFYGGVFQNCSSLIKINIPEGITTIEDNTFNGCSSLKEITIPDSVVSIGDYAFYYCSSLKEIIIPDSVTSIGKNVFDFRTSKTVYYDGNATGSPWGATKHVTIKNYISWINSTLQKALKPLEEIDKIYPDDKQLATKARNNKLIADQVSIMTSLLEKGLEFTKKFKI